MSGPKGIQKSNHLQEGVLLIHSQQMCLKVPTRSFSKDSKRYFKQCYMTHWNFFSPFTGGFFKMNTEVKWQCVPYNWKAQLRETQGLVWAQAVLDSVLKSQADSKKVTYGSSVWPDGLHTFPVELFQSSLDPSVRSVWETELFTDFTGPGGF